MVGAFRDRVAATDNTYLPARLNYLQHPENLARRHWGKGYALEERRDFDAAALAPLFDNASRYYRRSWHVPAAEFSLPQAARSAPAETSQRSKTRRMGATNPASAALRKSTVGSWRATAKRITRLRSASAW
jgi:hypothetical protein